MITNGCAEEIDVETFVDNCLQLIQLYHNNNSNNNMRKDSGNIVYIMDIFNEVLSWSTYHTFKSSINCYRHHRVLFMTKAACLLTNSIICASGGNI